MSEPENAVSESVGDDDQAAPGGPARAVFGGRLRARADDAVADGGPDAGPTGSPIEGPVERSIAPPADPPPSVLRHLIDRPDTEPMVWALHPISGERLLKVPAELPAGWSGEAAVPATPAAPAELPPLTAETVLRELARIAFTDPLPARTRAGARLPVTLRDKQNALLHLGRHLGLFSGRPPARRPYAELSDAELKAQSDDIIRDLARMGVEVQIAEDEAGAEGGAPPAP